MTKKQVDKLIEGIYDGSVTAYEIPESLYYMIARRLLDGLYEGYGATLKTVEAVDEAMLTALRTNVFQFSAAKSYQQLQVMSEKLAETKVFAEFKKEAEKVFDQYNKTWLKTEYDTAIGQAQNIVKWQEIEKTKDILPYLRYSAIIDPNTSEICRPLDGIVAKVDDPIWQKVAPLNHFNCRCLLIQEFDAVETEGRERIAEEVQKEMQPLFEHNPYFTKQIFDKSHPYFQVPGEDKEFARTNFGLPIPPTDDFSAKKVGGYTELKTISEVESFMKAKNIADVVNFTGANIDSANVVAKTFSELKEEYPTKKLNHVNNKIRSTSKTRAHTDGTMVEYNFGYIGKDPVNYTKQLEIDYVAKQQAIIDQWEQSKKNKPQNFDTSTRIGRQNQKALDSLYEGLKFRRWSLSGGDIERTTTHEYGHLLELQYLGGRGMKNNRVFTTGILPKEKQIEILNNFAEVSYKIKKSNDKFLISEYAMSSNNEMWAELFTMYRYERSELPEYVKEFVESTLETFKNYAVK